MLLAAIKSRHHGCAGAVFFPFDFYLFYSLFFNAVVYDLKRGVERRGLGLVDLLPAATPYFAKNSGLFFVFYDGGGEAAHQQVAEVRERNAHKAAGGSGRRIVSH